MNKNVGRRDFLKKTIIGGVATATYPASSEEKGSIFVGNNAKQDQFLARSTSFFDHISPLDTGAKFDGLSDDTVGIQRWLDMADRSGVIVGPWPRGTAMISNTLIWHSKVYAQGAGFGLTVIKMRPGINKNIIESKDFSDNGEIYDFGFKGISFDGNYFLGDHYAAQPIVGNYQGDGIRIRGHSFDIDVEINNVPGVGALFERVKPRPGSSRDMPARLSFYGRIFGQEGLIMRGPGDHIVREAFVGASGLLPRPSAEYQRSRSLQYPGDGVNGIVVDCNAEWGKIHTYANWSGSGIVTLGNSRFQCEHLISESNLSQCHFKKQTYGGISLASVRNLACLHPSWREKLPSYQEISPEFDAITLDCSSFSISNLRLERMSNTTKRIIGVGGLIVNGDSNRVFLTSWRIEGRRGDLEEGRRLSGVDFSVRGKCNDIKVQIRDSQDTAGIDSGLGNIITGTILNPRGIGFRGIGHGSRIELTVVGQKKNKPNDAAYSDGGSGNMWSVGGANNENLYFSDENSEATLISSGATSRAIDAKKGLLEISGFDRHVEIVGDLNDRESRILTIRGGRFGQIISISIERFGFLISLDNESRIVLTEDKKNILNKPILILYFNGQRWSIQQ